MDTASALDIFAAFYAPVSLHDYTWMTRPKGWQEFLMALRDCDPTEPGPSVRYLQSDQAERLPKHLRLLKRPPSYSELSGFQRRYFTGGLPQSVVPVESLYRQWTVRTDSELCFSHEKGFYNGDAAGHMRYLYQSLDLHIESEQQLHPDHLSLELSFAAMLVGYGRPADVALFIGEHFGWLSDFSDALKEKASPTDSCTAFMCTLTDCLAAFIEQLKAQAQHFQALGVACQMCPTDWGRKEKENLCK
ncbi:MAG: molecular chaperone TorD family protein [Coriobacteriia bacterium]|nr:molecular chaperone TorD family protein [Coriobacteriia bacterium]